MQKECAQCKFQFEITEEDLKFYDKVSPVFAGKKYLISPPTLCPDCREQRRRAVRNDRFYYPRNCDLCQKSMISLYDPARVKNVYCNTCWWSDKWDPLAFGRDYDFSRPFFTQFKELLNEIAKINMMNDNNVQSTNCEYTSDFAIGKNVYLVNNSWHVEDSMFGYQINFVKNCLDNLYLYFCELLYECTFADKSYNCQHCLQIKDCSDLIFGYDLIGCNDCILCAGLRNKKYCIWNKQYTKKEYFVEKEKLRLDTWDSRQILAKKFADFILTIPRKYANLINCEDCTGDNLIRSKNSKECYNFPHLFHCKFLTDGDGAKDSYDCNSTGNPELCYNCLTPDNGYMNSFTINCWNSQYLLYSENCHIGSQYLFGCSGLKKKKYCILNKQYTKENYEKLLSQIIEHMTKNKEWGEFFTAPVTFFAYNETSANEYFPLNEDQAKKLGYTWINIPTGSFGRETIKTENIPDSINEFGVDGSYSEKHNILQDIIACKNCSKNYKINKQEFDFYKNHTIPLPRLCPDCRHKNRRSSLNPKKLWHRECMCDKSNHSHSKKCSQIFETTFAPDRKEIVFCEKCYLGEVY